MAGVIVLDAGVLIALSIVTTSITTGPRRFSASEIDDDFAINSLTLAEVLVAPARDDRLEAVLAALKNLGVLELPFPPDSAAKLATLRARTNLKVPDCCVVLAAEVAGARLASFDDRLVAAATTRQVVTVTD